MFSALQSSQIKYVSGPAGSGKTHKMIQMLPKAIKGGQRFVIALPEKQNAVEVAERIRSSNPYVRYSVINRDTVPQGEPVISAYLRELDRDDLDVIIITHSTMFAANFMSPGRRRWDIIVDEVFDVDDMIQINLSETGEHWLHMFEAEDDIFTDSFVRLNVKREYRKYVSDLARNKNGDTLIESINSFLKAACDPHRILWVRRTQWLRARNRTGGLLHIHTVLEPGFLDGYKSVTVMGANFSSSLLYLIWRKLGITFRRHGSIVVEDAPIRLGKNQEVKVEYLSEQKWSRNLLNRIGGLRRLSEAFEGHLDDSEPYLLALNKHMDFADWSHGGTVVSPKCRGYNEYREYTKAVYLASLNDRSPHFGFLSLMFGITPEQLTNAKFHEAIYQTLMRTKLRTGEFTKVHFIVPDAFSAGYLADSIAGINVSRLDLGIEEFNLLGQPSLKAVVKTREQIREEAREQMREYRRRNQELLSSIQKLGKQVRFMASFEESKQSTDVVGVEFNGFKDLIALLIEHHETSTPRSPKGGMLISSGEYHRVDELESIKSYSNLHSNSFMVLDFDKSQLSPKLLGDILDGIEHFVVNSHSNGRDGLYSYHCYVPFAFACDVKSYKHIFDLLVERIRDYGYSVGNDSINGPKSGLDMSKRTPVSWFHLPRKSAYTKRRDEFGSSFYEYRKGNPIDPEEWAYRRKMTIKTKAVSAKRKSKSPTQEQIDSAIAVWRATPKGQGNEAFFRLGSTLYNAGLGLAEVQKILLAETHTSGSNGHDRTRQVGSIITSLSRSLRPSPILS